MRTIAILNACGLRPYALKGLAGGPSALARAIARAKAIEGIEAVLVMGRTLLAAGSAIEFEKNCRAEGVPSIDREILSAPELLNALSELAAGYDALVLIPADAPFMDPELSARLMRLHEESASEFTFADGYPRGLSPEILRVASIPAMALSAAKKASAAKGGLPREPLFSAIEKDVNSFDVETIVSPIDMRAFRLSLFCDSAANAHIVERVLLAAMDDGSDPLAGAERLSSFLAERRDLHRGLPAFYYVQVADGCPQECHYCPYPKARPGLRSDSRHMALGEFSRLVSMAADFSKEAVIGLSLWGEPGLHPDPAGLCRAVLAHPGLSLLIETSGLGWKEEAISAIAGLPGSERAEWIVSLDAADPAVYAAMRGEGLSAALAFTDKLLSLFPGRVHVQAVRTKRNEEGLEAFYRSWKERGVPVIVQKHDHFCGFLPDERVCDISPLSRIECWHLKRDLCVLSDGGVPLCREDLRCLGAEDRGLVGNALTDGVEKVWAAMERTFLDHVAGRFEGICRPCDEHYTYNF